MEKEKLKKLIEEGYSLNKISKEIGKSLTTIRYWAKKYDLKSNYKNSELKVYGSHRFCPRCKNHQVIENFYARRGKLNSSVYCKKCTSNQILERTRKLKQQMVEYKGGNCVRCGYDKYIGALEFHHLDPTKKDYTLAHLKVTNFHDKIKNELDKCILVCANCHREIHNELLVAPEGIEPPLNL